MEKKEFKPYYQPKVDVTDNRLCGAEALVRWEHEGKLIPPFRFIPPLEQTNDICKLDFYMLDYVCADIKEWMDKGMNPPTISVNFSRRNLGNPTLAEDIYKVIQKYQIPANLIQVEITETVDEYPIEYLKGVVESLKEYGLSTAIDDFGTGSASINLILEVPFDVLKIDKAFVDSMDEKKKNVLGHIVSLAKEVGADVITEGVEDVKQIEVLQSLNCTKIQGYYFDKPLPKTEFENRICHPIYEK